MGGHSPTALENCGKVCLQSPDTRGLECVSFATIRYVSSRPLQQAALPAFMDGLCAAHAAILPGLALPRGYTQSLALASGCTEDGMSNCPSVRNANALLNQKCVAEWFWEEGSEGSRDRCLPWCLPKLNKLNTLGISYRRYVIE